MLAPIAAPIAPVARSGWRLPTAGGAIDGELVVAERWHPAFDGPLEAGYAFRAVLLTGQRGAVDSSNPRVRVLRRQRPAPPTSHGIAEPTTPYGALALVDAALATDTEWPRFRQVAAAALHAYVYAFEAVVPAERQDLELDRTGLLERLAPGYLAGHPDTWPAVAASLEWFQARYQALYRDRHRAHVTATATARRQLLTGQEYAAALTLLDTVPELGPPAGEDALAAWATTLVVVQPCGADGAAPDFAASRPVCDHCGYRMDSVGFGPLVQQTLDGVRTALDVQLRRLSSATVKRILREAHRPSIDRFLRALRASDAAVFVRVLDADTVHFLRDLLGAYQAEAPATGVLAALRDRYGVMEEADIPAAVAEFRRLLKNAAASIQRQGTATPVRFRLE